jgi:hypothetical protein
VIRRRRRRAEEAEAPTGPEQADGTQAEEAWAEDEPVEDEPDEGADTPVIVGEGPWDAAEPHPQDLDRIDFGSLRVPISPGFEVQVSLTPAEEEGMAHVVAIVVAYPGGALEVSAFAAPKRDGIWDDVLREIREGLAEDGGEVEQVDGPFGAELRAIIPVEVPEEARPELPEELRDAEYVMQPARFIGVDGPRWLLRGVIKGPAAEDAEQAQPLEDIFQGIVVDRGDQPMPPRDLLPLTLPQEAQEALAMHVAEEGEDEDGRQPLDPFTRGPEITEVR